VPLPIEPPMVKFPAIAIQTQKEMEPVFETVENEKSDGLNVIGVFDTEVVDFQPLPVFKSQSSIEIAADVSRDYGALFITIVIN
jgi:hypothetical protein